MTAVLEVLTKYCAVYVDDERLTELAATNAPLYAKKMCGYFIPAISLFTIPANVKDYLVGDRISPNFVAPTTANKRLILSQSVLEPTVFNLGDDYKGFELFAASIVTILDGGQGAMVEPTAICTYDKEAGTVTINASADKPVDAGTIFDFDFYTDGYFKNDLSIDMLNILGLCFQVVWQNRFNTDWLSIVPKTEDKSFFEQNRANKMNADTERLRQAKQQLAGEMRAYEQRLGYKGAVSADKRFKF